ncbi:MAG: hypothetical protein JXA96_07810 [Sedimentisphaerales bacterium]|nr:hypothetical protein [Sedimentisphaerales bacterium]
MSKREIPDKGTDLQNRKKKKLKKLICWLAIDLSVAFIVFALLLYKPSQYNPVFVETDEISSSLLKLYSVIHDKSQLNDPFEIVVTQDALKDIINLADWPMESEGVLLYSPDALIDPNFIVLMGTADFQGMEFIITIELQAKINEQGLMDINVSKIKVGAVNVTPLAKITAQKMYKQKLEEIGDIDLYSWQAKIAASLLTDEAIEPVFEIENQTLKVEKITIDEGRLTINLLPI